MAAPAAPTTGRDVFIGVVGVAALLTIGLGLVRIPSDAPFGPDPLSFAVLAALLVLFEMRPLGWYGPARGLDLTVTWSFAAAIAMLAPFGTAVAALAVASTLGDLVARKALTRVVFNSAQLTLSLAAGVAVLELAHARFVLVGEGPVPRWFPLAGIGAGLAILVANGLLVSGVIALDRKIPLSLPIRTSLLGNLATDGLLLAMAPAYVIVSERSLPLLPLLLGSAVAVHGTAQLAVQRQEEANHDPLTGLATRRVLQDRLDEVVDATASTDKRGAVLVLDLDGFKDLNDRLGHAAGDAVLRATSERLEQAVRPGDVVARLGGDEFAVVAFPIDDGATAQHMADTIAAALRPPIEIDGYPVAVQASIGIAVSPEHSSDSRLLLERADVAMYEAKRRRLGSVVFAGGGPSQGRVALLQDLPRALTNGDLHLRYQPMVRIATGEVVGVEALVRWRHERYGVVEPIDFIPMAEQTELVRDLTALVLDHALAAWRDWTAAGHDVVVSINGSARNLEDSTFADLVAERLAAAAVPAARLEIEITENAVLRNADRAVGIVHALHDLGVRFAVDDFGTGFSSLVHLRDLPLDRVKIDRSFIGDLGTVRGTAIVGPLCDLARNLGLESVAEGVESQAALDQLGALGCDLAQGFVLAPPLDATELLAWLGSRPTAVGAERGAAS